MGTNVIVLVTVTLVFRKTGNGWVGGKQTIHRKQKKNSPGAGAAGGSADSSPAHSTGSFPSSVASVRAAFRGCVSPGRGGGIRLSPFDCTNQNIKTQIFKKPPSSPRRWRWRSGRSPRGPTGIGAPRAPQRRVSPAVCPHPRGFGAWLTLWLAFLRSGLCVFLMFPVICSLCVSNIIALKSTRRFSTIASHIR